MEPGQQTMELLRLMQWNEDRYKMYVFEKGCAFIESYFTAMQAWPITQAYLYAPAYWKWWVSHFETRNKRILASIGTKYMEKLANPNGLQDLFIRGLETKFHTYHNVQPGEISPSKVVVDSIAEMHETFAKLTGEIIDNETKANNR